MILPGGIDPILSLKIKEGVRLSPSRYSNPALKLMGLTGSDAGPAMDYAVSMLTTNFLSHDQPYSSSPVVVMVGCGGTGSHLLPNLLQFTHSFPSITYLVIDGDEVEEKNLKRQRFISSDLGKNKADVLAQRYSTAFGLEIHSYPNYIKSSEELIKLVNSITRPRAADPLLIIGASDNHLCRAIMFDTILSALLRETFYIDCGNDKYHGQAILGFKSGNRINQRNTVEWDKSTIGSKIQRVSLPSYFDLYPDEILKIKDEVAPNACAAQAEEDPQTIQANTFSALAGSALAYQVLSGEIFSSRIEFDSRRGGMKATPLTKKSIAEGLLAIEKSRKTILEHIESLDSKEFPTESIFRNINNSDVMGYGVQ